MPASLQPLLDPSFPDFVAGGVSILVATRGPQMLPNVVRAVGCRVPRDLRQLRVLLPRAQSRPLIEDLAANGAIAVVFNKPTTHVAYQFKGTDARIATLEPEDEVAAVAYLHAMVIEVGKMGFREPGARALLACPVTGLVPVVFTPTLAFDQTPGPRAGQPLEPRR